MYEMRTLELWQSGVAFIIPLLFLELKAKAKIINKDHVKFLSLVYRVDDKMPNVLCGIPLGVWDIFSILVFQSLCERLLPA